MLNFVESTVSYHDSLGSINSFDREASVLVYDKALEGKEPFSSFIVSFPYRYGVKGGEKLKNIVDFPEHVNALFNLFRKMAAPPSCLVGFGGGSLSDFTGFTASVIKRGIAFHLVPTTWLAAIDSAHGGKNALNSADAKNQIGTFHCAQTISICRDVLMSEADDRFQDALSEAIKISIICGLDFPEEPSVTRAWDFLPALIEAKYDIVREDLFDQKGIRVVLNFGHTMGHVFESTYGISHGQAVALGLRFSLEWSRHLKFINNPDFEKVVRIFNPLPEWHQLNLPPMEEKKLRATLIQDKKLGTDSAINFVFIRAHGDVFAEAVGVDDIVKEAIRQKVTV